jgi:hypothetical protein
LLVSLLALGDEDDPGPFVYPKRHETMRALVEIGKTALGWTRWSRPSSAYVQPW